jgi:hypothetical protein
MIMNEFFTDRKTLNMLKRNIQEIIDLYNVKNNLIPEAEQELIWDLEELIERRTRGLSLQFELNEMD